MSHNFIYPPYKRVFTSLQTTTVLLAHENGSLEKIFLNIDMPQININFGGSDAEGAIIYRKYLEPPEFNIFVQSKFSEWEKQAVEYF